MRYDQVTKDEYPIVFHDDYIIGEDKVGYVTKYNLACVPLSQIERVQMIIYVSSVSPFPTILIVVYQFLMLKLFS